MSTTVLSMQLPLALVVLGGLVVISAALGLLLKAGSGRVRVAAADSRPLIHPDQLGEGITFGSSATLVQFSTEFCAQCPATRRLLGELGRNAGVRHIEIDVTDDLALADRFAIRQTPTTLLLDGDGRQVARIGGPPRRAELDAQLAVLTAAARPSARPSTVASRESR